MNRYQCSFITLLCLAGCTTTQTPAPIVNRPAPGARQTAPSRPVTPVAVQPVIQPKPTADVAGATYTVKKGDGLYRIALDHGLAYRDLADWNNIANVDEIKVDQVLRLTPPENNSGVVVRPLRDANGSGEAQTASTVTAPLATVETRNYPKALKLPYGTQSAETIAKQAEGPGVALNASVTSKPSTIGVPKPTNGESSAVSSKKPEKSEVKASSPAKQDEENGVSWVPPTAGKLLKPYTDEAKGVDLVGKMGQPVNASESGKVVYAGSGLRGYGKMVIIKHNNAYLSAYAHNSKLLVKEGDAVKRGEKIAEMGNSDTDQVKLHFEIRKFGKPVDPTKFITADKP